MTGTAGKAAAEAKKKLQDELTRKSGANKDQKSKAADLEEKLRHAFQKKIESTFDQLNEPTSPGIKKQNSGLSESAELKSPLIAKSRMRRGQSNMQGREDVYKFVRESASMYNPIAASMHSTSTPESMKQIKNLQDSAQL